MTKKWIKLVLYVVGFGSLVYVIYIKIFEKRVIKRSWLALKFSSVITFHAMFADINSSKSTYVITTNSDERIILVKDNFLIQDEPFVKNNNYEITLVASKDSSPSNFPSSRLGLPSPNSATPSYPKAAKVVVYRQRPSLKPFGGNWRRGK